MCIQVHVECLCKSTCAVHVLRIAHTNGRSTHSIYHARSHVQLFLVHVQEEKSQELAGI